MRDEVFLWFLSFRIRNPILCMDKNYVQPTRYCTTLMYISLRWANPKA